MIQLSDNMRGALLMCVSMAAFTFGDASIKATGGDLPLSQLLVIRGTLATAALIAMAMYFKGLKLRLPAADWALIVGRGLAEAAAAYFFLTALLVMPLANVNALLQMLPLTVTLGGALVFREAVGWRRWTAIIIGFIGMLLIVRPGTDGFTSASVYALCAVAAVTVRDLVTRRVSKAVGCGVARDDAGLRHIRYQCLQPRQISIRQAGADKDDEVEIGIGLRLETGQA